MDDEKLLQIADDQLNFLDRMSAMHQRRMLDSIQALERRIVDRASALKTSDSGNLLGAKTNLAQAQKVHSDMTALFDEEYGAASRETVKEYSESLPVIQQQYEDMGEAVKYTGVDKDMVKGLKSMDLAAYTSYGLAAQDKIAKAVYNHVIAQAPFSALVSEIAAALTGQKDKRGRPLANYAKQMANDGIMNFHNTVNLKKAEDAGFTHYLYVGNIIADSRPFCIARAGNVYTREQIDSWTGPWQGKSGPAFTHRGGYNCRHHWQPMRKEWIPDGGIEVQSWFDRAGVMPVSKLPKAVTGAPKFKAWQAWQQSVIVGNKPLDAAAVAKAAGVPKSAASGWLSQWQRGYNLPQGWQSAVRDLEAKAGGFERVKPPTVEKMPVPSFDRDLAIKNLDAASRVGFSGKPSATGRYIESRVPVSEIGEAMEKEITAIGRQIKEKIDKPFYVGMEVDKFVSEEMVNVRDLVGWQPVAEVKKVQGIISSSSLYEPVMVVKHRGQLVLWDGYHRVNANILGDSWMVRAKIYDLDSYVPTILKEAEKIAASPAAAVKPTLTAASVKEAEIYARKNIVESVITTNKSLRSTLDRLGVGKVDLSGLDLEMANSLNEELTRVLQGTKIHGIGKDTDKAALFSVNKHIVKSQGKETVYTIFRYSPTNVKNKKIFEKIAKRSSAYHLKGAENLSDYINHEFGHVLDTYQGGEVTRRMVSGPVKVRTHWHEGLEGLLVKNGDEGKIRNAIYKLCGNYSRTNDAEMFAELYRVYKKQGLPEELSFIEPLLKRAEEKYYGRSAVS